MNETEKTLLKRITSVQGLMGGKPVIRGLRFPVSDILELLASGLSKEEILEQHPILEPDDISAALLFASLSLKNTAFVHDAA
jgi:uncharacterized protein (DUF433 family)